MYVWSFSSKASLKLKFLQLRATVSHPALMLWLMCGHWAGRGSDSPTPIHVVHYSVRSLKSMMLRTSQGFLSPLTNTQSTNVAIFVSDCDYMLTDHLHDYQHLCRYIDEIGCVLDGFSLSFQLETLYSYSQLTWGITLSVGILCFCVLANHSETKQQIHNHLSPSSAVTSWPQTNSRSLPLGVGASNIWLSSLDSSRCLELNCFAIVIIVRIQIDKTWLII